MMATSILRKNEIYFDFGAVKKQVPDFELTKEHVLIMLRDLKVSLEECLAIEVLVLGAFVKFNCKNLFKYLLNVPIYFKHSPMKSYRIDARHEIIVKVEGLPLDLSWNRIKDALSRFGTIYTVEFEFFERETQGDKLKKTGIRLLHMELRKPIPLCPVVVCGYECWISHPGQKKGLLSIPPVQREWFVVEGWKPNTYITHIRNQCIEKIGSSDVRVEPLFKEGTRAHRKSLAFKICVRLAYLRQGIQQHIWPNLKIRMFFEKLEDKSAERKENVSPLTSSLGSESTRRAHSPEVYHISSVFLF